MTEPKKYSVFVYQVKHGQTVVATYCLEQDAIDYVKKHGGEIYTLGAY